VINAAVGPSEQPLFTVDSDGMIHEFNGAAGALLGLTANTALGARCYELLKGQTWSGAAICGVGCPHLRLAVEGTAPAPMDMVVTCAGRAGPCDLRVHHIALRGERTGRVLHVLEDVGNQRHRERVGARLEALRAGTGPADGLTKRELEVLRLLADGLTSQQIADELGIRPSTARNHAQRVLAKLGVTSRVAAVLRFLEGAERLP
jgi:DNA-binding CsgD family transcriptional regulator